MFLATLLSVVVLSVHDGDTLTVNLPCSLPPVCDAMPLRITGIDTPEMRDSRPAMRLLAQQAKSRLLALMSQSHHVQVKLVGRDKYFRLDAEVYSDGVSVAKTLLAEGLARPYQGVGPRPW